VAIRPELLYAKGRPWINGNGRVGSPFGLQMPHGGPDHERRVDAPPILVQSPSRCGEPVVSANVTAEISISAGGSTVPFVTIDREHAAIRDDLRAAFNRVLRRGTFVLGDEVERFESAWASACGTAHCVGVASGTAALTALLRAAGIGPGDEVIVPAHTYIATALSVLDAGGTPVLCDVDDRTGLMDPAAANAAVGPRTAAILPVHLYGQLCEMRPLTRLAERHGLALLEDAAQAHGATHQGRPAGGFGAGADCRAGRANHLHHRAGTRAPPALPRRTGEVAWGR